MRHLTWYYKWHAKGWTGSWWQRQEFTSSSLTHWFHMISVNLLNTPRTFYHPPVIKICRKVHLVPHQFLVGITPPIKTGKEVPSVWNDLSSASENMDGSRGLEKSQRLCGVLVMHRRVWWQALGAPWVTPASAAVMKSWLFTSSQSQCHHLCWAQCRWWQVSLWRTTRGEFPL